MSFNLLSSEDVTQTLASRLKSRRLDQNLTLKGLSSRSGVAVSTLKKFEQSGQISLKSFVKLASTLQDNAALENLLLAPEYTSIEEVLAQRPQAKRGRIN